MPVAARKKRITNPDDASQFVDLNMPDDLGVSQGSGLSFLRTLYRFQNNPQPPNYTVRRGYAETITHKARLEGDDPDDESQRLEVEVMTGSGTWAKSGIDFEREKYILNPDIETDDRKSHITRVYNENDPDLWLDVRRYDEIIVTHGSGLEYQKTILKINWNDEDFDAPNDLIPDQDDPPDENYDPPWRLDWLQRIIGVSWGGAVEFETDIVDPHGTTTGNDLPDIDFLHQPATTIEHPIKMTFDISFNISPEADTVIAEFTRDYIPLIQFGGNGSFPRSSAIQIANVGEGGNSDLGITARFVGPYKEIVWGETASFYGIILEDLTRRMARMVEGSIKLSDIKTAFKRSLAGFSDKWHSLQVIVDASDEDEFLEVNKHVSYAWLYEADGSWTDGPLTFQGVIGTNSGLIAAGVTVDPANTTYSSPIIDLRPGDLNLSLLPDPETVPGQRVFVYYIDIAGFRAPPGSIVGVAYTSNPQTSLGESNTIPMKMYLDRKSMMTTDESAGPGKVAVQIVDTGDPETPVEATNGFILKTSRLAIPRQLGTRPTFDIFDGGLAFDVRQRRARMQIWFDKYIDPSTETVMNKFLTKKTIKINEVDTVVCNLAQLTPEERQQYIDLGITSPNDQLSPAALAFGKPHVFLRGSPLSFVQNRGSGGEFVKVNDIETFSPAPSNIPVIP